MSDALGSLAEAVDARDAAQAQQAAIDAPSGASTSSCATGLQTDIDRARFDLWAARLTVDAAAGDAAAVNGDLFTLDYIRDRILHTLDGADATRVNSALEELQTADEEDRSDLMPPSASGTSSSNIKGEPRRRQARVAGNAHASGEGRRALDSRQPNGRRR